MFDESSDMIKIVPEKKTKTQTENSLSGLKEIFIDRKYISYAHHAHHCLVKQCNEKYWQSAFWLKKLFEIHKMAKPTHWAL